MTDQVPKTPSTGQTAEPLALRSNDQLGPTAWACVWPDGGAFVTTSEETAKHYVEGAAKHHPTKPVEMRPLYALGQKDLMILSLYREQQTEALGALGAATARVRQSAAKLGNTVAEWTRRFGA